MGRRREQLLDTAFDRRKGPNDKRYQDNILAGSEHTQTAASQKKKALQQFDDNTVGGLGSEDDKTVIPEPKNWNPISSSKCTVLARHD